MNPLQHALNGVTAPEEVKARTMARLSSALEGRAGRSNLPRLAAALACLVLMLAGLGGWQVWNAPVSYISIDVNPSIELALNRFDRVVGTTAYNDDGAQVLSGLSVRGLPYQEAINALFDDPAFRSYLDEDAKVVFTVVSDSEAELRKGIQSGNMFLSCDSAYFRADTHCLKEAHENGLSVGKYRIYEELSYYDSGITVEDCHRMTVGELQQELDRCSGHGYGHGAQGDHHSGVSVPPEETPGAGVSVSPGSYEQGAGGHEYMHGQGHH